MPKPQTPEEAAVEWARRDRDIALFGEGYVVVEIDPDGSPRVTYVPVDDVPKQIRRRLKNDKSLDP